MKIGYLYRVEAKKGNMLSIGICRNVLVDRKSMSDVENIFLSWLEEENKEREEQHRSTLRVAIQSITYVDEVIHSHKYLESTF